MGHPILLKKYHSAQSFLWSVRKSWFSVTCVTTCQLTTPKPTHGHLLRAQTAWTEYRKEKVETLSISLWQAICGKWRVENQWLHCFHLSILHKTLEGEINPYKKNLEIGRDIFPLFYFLNDLGNSASTAKCHLTHFWGKKIIKWKMITDEMQGNHAYSALTN